MMAASNLHWAASSDWLIWIDRGGDIHLLLRFIVGLSINPASACHSNYLLSLSQIAFPWSKALVFFHCRGRETRLSDRERHCPC